MPVNGIGFPKGKMKIEIYETDKEVHAIVCFFILNPAGLDWSVSANEKY